MEIHEKSLLMLSACNAILGHIAAIKEENSPEIVNVYIDAIQDIQDRFFPGCNIQADIRSGRGNLSRI